LIGLPAPWNERSVFHWGLAHLSRVTRHFFSGQSAVDSRKSPNVILAYRGRFQSKVCNTYDTIKGRHHNRPFSIPSHL